MIKSLGDTLVATVNDRTFIVWARGAHHANVYVDRNPIAADVFTFAWEKDRTSQLDFTRAFLNYTSWLNAATEGQDV